MIGILPLFPAANLDAQPYGYEDTTEEFGRIVTFEEFTTELDFRVEYEEDEETTYKRVGQNKRGEQTSTFEQERLNFEERVTLDGKGYSLHPNLMTFRFRTTLGFRQEDERGDFSEDEDETFHENNIELGFFRTKPFNFTLFSSIYSTSIDREFFESIDVDTQLYGGVFHYQHERFPMRLELETQKREEDSQDFERDRTEKTLEYEVTHELDDILRSSLRYIYKKIDERVPTDQTIKTHDVSLDSSLEYNNVRLTSGISYNTTSERIDTKHFQLFENMYIDHSDTLTSLFNYNFNYFNTDDFTSRRHYIDMGLRHSLYDSLETELRWRISHTKTSDSKEFYYGPKFDIVYRKNVPGGRFTAGYNVFYRRTDSETDEGVQSVFGERIILSDEGQTFFGNPNVILSTVIVRDEAGVRLTEGTDYRLIPRGSLVEIKRIDLPNNTLVQVDYRYEIPDELDYDSVISNVLLRYDIGEFLSFYYNYNSTIHHIDTDLSKFEGVSPLQEEKVSAYGADLRWRWFDVETEYEDDRSDLVPFTAFRVRSSFKIQPLSFMIFTLTGNHAKTRFKDDRREVRLNTAEASLSFRLSQYLDAELRGGYFDEEGDDIDDTIWKVTADLTSRFRSIEMRLETEYLDREEITEDREEFKIKFKLVRYFEIL